MTHEIDLRPASDGVKPMNGKRMNKSGFTLLDTLIVVSLVGLLAGIVFPRIADVQSRFAVRGATMAFMSNYSLTRATAIREGRVAELHIDATNDRFWVEVDTTLAGSGTMDTVGLVVDVGGEGVTLTSTQSLLCFDGRGMPSAASGCATGGATITVGYDTEADTIQITTLGKILR